MRGYVVTTRVCTFTRQTKPRQTRQDTVLTASVAPYRPLTCSCVMCTVSSAGVEWLQPVCVHGRPRVCVHGSPHVCARTDAINSTHALDHGEQHMQNGWLSICSRALHVKQSQVNVCECKHVVQMREVSAYTF